MENLPHHLWIGFAGGLIAFAHCIGMCGGFVLHLSQEKDRKQMLVNHLLWQGARASTYTFLGAMAGFTGGFLKLLFLDHPLFRNLLSYASGAIILLMGLSLLGMLPVRVRNPDSGAGNTFFTLCSRIAASSSPGKALAMGIATGFLPCPVLLAFLAYSLQSGSVAAGMATMGAVAFGTMLPLLLLGGVTRLTGLHLRSLGPKAGGLILILLGLTTLLRGTELFHHLLGCPAQPSLHRSASSQTEPCSMGETHGNGSGH